MCCCQKMCLSTIHLTLSALCFGAIPSLCQLLGAPGGCSPIASLSAQQLGGGSQTPFQQPFGPAFGCPMNSLGAFGRQFPPPPPPPGAGGQFSMQGQSVNVNPNFMGSQQQPNGGGNNFGTGGSSCNCGSCCADGNNFGMPTNEFGNAMNVNSNGIMNNNNLNGIAGGGAIDMVNGGGGGMGVFGRRRRR